MIFPALPSKNYRTACSKTGIEKTVYNQITVLFCNFYCAFITRCRPAALFHGADGQFGQKDSRRKPIFALADKRAKRVRRGSVLGLGKWNARASGEGPSARGAARQHLASSQARTRASRFLGNNYAAGYIITNRSSSRVSPTRARYQHARHGPGIRARAQDEWPRKSALPMRLSLHPGL